jgi:hypothetical protein
LTSVATVRGVVPLLAFAAVSAPAATSFCTTARLLHPGPALAQAMLMSDREPVAKLLQQQPRNRGNCVSQCTADEQQQQPHKQRQMSQSAVR